jgi:hypothetical protein
MATKPKFLVTSMSRQIATNLAPASAFRRSPVCDSILHRDIKSLIVVCLRIV